MKLNSSLYFLSLIILLTNHANAELIHIEFHSSKILEAKEIRDYFVQSYQIPKELIVLEQTKNCVHEYKNRFTLCLDSKAALNEMNSEKDNKVWRNSIMSFSQMIGIRNEV